MYYKYEEDFSWKILRSKFLKTPIYTITFESLLFYSREYEVMTPFYYIWVEASHTIHNRSHLWSRSLFLITSDIRLKWWDVINCIAKAIGSLKKGVNLILLICRELNNDIYQRVKEFTELIFSVHIILAYSKNIKPSSSSRE